jgi:sigma-B regulation protein RsbU (phosphoserine phosphatase)
MRSETGRFLVRALRTCVPQFWRRLNNDLRQVAAECERIEEALRQSEAQYHDLVEHLQVGVVALAPDTSIVQCNRRAADLLGIPDHQVRGKKSDDTAWSLVREDGAPLPVEEYPANRVLVTRQPLRDVVVGINRPDTGQRIWVQVNAFPQVDGDDHLQRVVVTFMDITQRKRIQEEDRLLVNTVLESIGDGLMITGPDGTIRYVNPAFEHISGYSRQELIGNNPRMLQSKQHDREFYRTMWDTILKGNVWRGTLIDKRKDGQLYDVESSISPIRDASGKTVNFVAVTRDVTERKRAEQALREREATREQLRVARSIQRSFFPVAAPELPGFDIAGASYPAEATGGDYFDYLPMPDGCLGIVLADVSGHGLGPALVMSQTRAYLRALLPLGLDVSELVTRLNHSLSADSAGNSFVTFFLALLDPRKRCFVHAGAGHQCYLLGAQGEVEVLESTGLPLGVLSGTVASGATRTLETGQLVLLLTDGIPEAQAPNNSCFGIERTLAVVQANRDQPARVIVEALYRAARDFAQGQQQDDITVVVVKVVESP